MENCSTSGRRSIQTTDTTFRKTRTHKRLQAATHTLLIHIGVVTKLVRWLKTKTQKIFYLNGVFNVLSIFVLSVQKHYRTDIVTGLSILNVVKVMDFSLCLW